MLTSSVLLARGVLIDRTLIGTLMYNSWLARNTYLVSPKPPPDRREVGFLPTVCRQLGI